MILWYLGDRGRFFQIIGPWVCRVIGHTENVKRGGDCHRCGYCETYVTVDETGIYYTFPYSCASNYCDDPACVMNQPDHPDYPGPHPELL